MNTHAIITFTKAKILLNHDDNERLKRVGLGDWFQHSTGKIKGSAIAEILTINEYYNRFPDERPQVQEEWQVPRSEYVPMENKLKTSARNTLLTELKKWCDKNPEAYKARALYESKLKASTLADNK